MPVMVDGLSDDVEIRYDIFLAGVIFEDGTLQKTLPQENFNSYGVTRVFFIKQERSGSVCHRASVWQNGKRIAYIY